MKLHRFILSFKSLVNVEIRKATLTSMAPELLPKNLPSAVVDQILNENTNRKCYALYKNDRGSYFFNHMPHGILAYYRLGATQEQMDRYLKRYGSKLEPRENYRDTQDDGESDKVYKREDIEKLKGQHKLYYPIVRFYENLLEKQYKGDLRQLIAGEFPQVAGGMMTSLLHAVIHIGYGLAANHAQVVCDGLGFLLHSYDPTAASAGFLDKPLSCNGSRSFVDVVAAIGGDPKRKERLEEYIDDICIPADALEIGSREALKVLTDWFVNDALMIFATSEQRNNFFFLHGVTCAWALKQIIDLDGDTVRAYRYVKIYLHCLLTFYVNCGCPPLNVANMDDGKSHSMEWKAISAEAIAKDDLHIAKLVQVCYDMDQTEEAVGRGKEYTSAFYKTAAMSSIIEDYSRGD